MRILVTGASGFIGNHLVNALKKRGDFVVGVDILRNKVPSLADIFIQADLRKPGQLDQVGYVDEVYALAADMGGMGYISQHDFDILRNNLLINIYTLDFARANNVRRYLFSSSACVYPQSLQGNRDIEGLKESDAYPADPQDGYGWEKLITERMLHYSDAGQYIARDWRTQFHIARFHNIFGPVGTWNGGKEKAPAALCRKVYQAQLDGKDSIDIWGDGEQTRSFCYIDDCIDALLLLMKSDYSQPLNIGTDRAISINDLALLILQISDHGKPQRTVPVNIKLNHVDGPQGVRGRNSDNTLAKQVLNWEPQISLEEGLARTYHWIRYQMQGQLVGR
jgi:GDP-D-mannose 3',5'-epimerase